MTESELRSTLDRVAKENWESVEKLRELRNALFLLVEAHEKLSFAINDIAKSVGERPKAEG